MTGQRFTVTRSGWWRFATGRTPEYLGEDKPDTLESVALVDHLDLDDGWHRIHIYQDTGTNMPLPLGNGRVVPNATWTTIIFYADDTTASLPGG